MTVSYECTADVSFLTAEELNKVTAALDEERYEWCHNGDELIVAGEREVDDYSWSAEDVAGDIEHILWKTADVDADASAEAVEYEPDWDKMPGGYDTIWN